MKIHVHLQDKPKAGANGGDAKYSETKGKNMNAASWSKQDPSRLPSLVMRLHSDTKNVIGGYRSI